MKKYRKIILLIITFIGIAFIVLHTISSFQFSLEIIRRKYEIDLTWWEPMIIFDHGDLLLSLVISLIPVFIGVFILKLKYLWGLLIGMGFIWELSLIGRILVNYPYQFSFFKTDEGYIMFDLTKGPIMYEWVIEDLLLISSGLALIIAGIVLRKMIDNRRKKQILPI